MTKKLPHPADKHVGTRVRMRRIQLGMSQEKLGEALNLTFQQVQKYEKGTNRISSSRLVQMSEILKMPVSWFFEGAPGSATAVAAPEASFDQFMATQEGVDIARSFMLIKPEMRRSIVNMVEAIAAQHVGAAA